MLPDRFSKFGLGDGEPVPYVALPWSLRNGTLSEEKQKPCHPEQAKRVEGSTHFIDRSSPFGAKILRLRSAALRMTA